MRTRHIRPYPRGDAPEKATTECTTILPSRTDGNFLIR